MRPRLLATRRSAAVTLPRDTRALLVSISSPDQARTRARTRATPGAAAAARVITASERRWGFHRRRRRRVKSAAAARLLPGLLPAGRSPSIEPSSSPVPGGGSHRRLCTICQSSGRPIKTFNLRLLVAAASSSPPPLKKLSLTSSYPSSPRAAAASRSHSLNRPSAAGGGCPAVAAQPRWWEKKKSQMLTRRSHPGLGCCHCPSSRA